MKAQRGWFAAWFPAGRLLPLVLFAACSGEGSDIGPKLPKLPSVSSKVVVLDDQGRGVASARVTVGASTMLTGRSGRGDLLASPRGRQVVAVDGANGAAVAGDRLGSVRFAATIVGPDLPAVVFLPDLPDSASASVTLGTQSTPVVLTSLAGAVLTVPTGVSIGFPAAVTTMPLRLGDLQAAHAPGDLPAPPTGALLTGRVCCIDPPDVTFAPAIDLDVADDLDLGSATASLFHLDPVTGEWTEVTTGLAAGAGRITAAAAITRGGLYVFGVQVTSTTVTGRVVDRQAVPSPVPDVLVAVDGRDAVTDRNGDFVVNGVPATLGNGAVRSASIELFAGGSWLPGRQQATVAVAASAPATTGDLVLDTVPAGNVRLQQVRRGRGDALRPARLSAVVDNIALCTFGDAAGQSLFEDVPARYHGFQDGRPIDARDLFYGQSLAFLDEGRRWQDAFQFFDERPLFLGTRRARALVTDAVGGGPVRDAVVVSGGPSDQRLVGTTDEVGQFFVDRDFDGRATAAVRTQRDGQTLVAIVSIERPDGEHVELPLRRVLRASNGAFDRHGLVTGVLQGATPGREHRLRVTRRLDLQEWWDDVVDGIPIRSALPIDVDPATTHAAFVAGVDRSGGHLVVAELTSAAGVATLHGIGLVADLEPVEGERTPRDLALDLPAVTTFAVPSGVAGLHPSIAAADLRGSLALEQPSGRIVDVVRGLGGNHTTTGADLTLQLPALSGQLAQHRWRVLLRGSGTIAGGTASQSSLLTLRGDGNEAAAPMLEPPVITAPAPAASVSANGFDVVYSLPADVLYATLELRSDTAGEQLLWQVMLPPDLTTFTFTLLPPEAPKALVTGRTYTLTLTAFRASGGFFRGSPSAYRDLSPFLQSIGAVERGVDSVSSHSITITSS